MIVALSWRNAFLSGNCLIRYVDMNYSNECLEYNCAKIGGKMIKDSNLNHWAHFCDYCTGNFAINKTN